MVRIANDLAENPPAFLTIERRAMVEAISERDGTIDATLSGGGQVVCDTIAAFTGFRPEPGIRYELPLEISPVTEGGARLARAICNVTDCLSVPRVTAKDLASGEPDFFFVGSRAYGRATSFLLQTGLAQAATILDSIAS